MGPKNCGQVTVSQPHRLYLIFENIDTIVIDKKKLLIK